jgi:hypothetical protein
VGEAGEDGLMKLRATNFISRLLVLVFLLTAGNFAFSQSNYKNGVFLELGGASKLYSINYERQLSKGFTGRIGLAYLSNTVAVPVLFGKVFGSKNHHLEISLGATYTNYRTQHYNTLNVLYREERNNGILLTGFAGYRYQKPEKRFLFRIGFTPLWRRFYSEDTYNDEPTYFIPWGGMSVGYRF